MRFESVRIANLRCFEFLDYAPDPRFSLICGPNGSGKTSLLEAFAIASLGRSFLTNNVTELVRNGAAGLSIRAVVADEGTGRSTVSVRKLRGETRIEVDGQQVRAASVLAQRLPLLAFNSKASDLLSESPGNRRALLDRTLFHVEPSYIEAWKTYRRALRQRNEILRKAGPSRDAAFWTAQLAEMAEAIDARRRALVAAINVRLEDDFLSGRFGALQLHYSPGWKGGSRLREQLDTEWPRDQALGYTMVGVHRADLVLRRDGRSVAARLSRGQGKVVVLAIFTALARFITEFGGTRPVFLADDLHAELDDTMRSEAVDMIAATGAQALFTAIRPRDLPAVLARTTHVFHVEQGGPRLPP